MPPWQTLVTKVLFVICHACKVPPHGNVTNSNGVPIVVPEMFTTNKNILVIETSRHGFLTGSPTYIIQSDGSKTPTTPNPLTVLNTMKSASTFQEVINRFSETIVPSSRDDRDPNKYYLLSPQSRGVARAPRRANKRLMMHESLLFLPGSDYYHGSKYSSQGIFMLDIKSGATNEIPEMFDLENITTLTTDHKNVRNRHVNLGSDNYMGKYFSSKGHILLSEILNNDVIGNGTAVIIMACKSICGTSDDQHGHHGLHDTVLADTVPSIKRVKSSDTGNAKQILFSPLDEVVGERSRYSDDDDSDDDEVGVGVDTKGGSKRKTTMKKTKFKHRKRPYINKKNKKRSSKKRPQTKKRKVLY